MQVWISYIQFEASGNSGDSKNLARKIFERANQALKTAGEKEERVKLMEAFKRFEEQYGDEESLERIKKIMPKQVVRTVRVTEDGVSTT